MSIYFSQRGKERYEEKKEKLQRLVAQTGQEAGDAAGMGCDWHDNAGYEEAKRNLEMLSTRLKEITDLLGLAVVHTVLEQVEAARIGNTVEIIIYDKEEETKKEITIGFFGETDAELGLVAYDSPLARALIGMEEGDIMEDVMIGSNLVNIELVKIHPPSYKYVRLIFDFYSAEANE